jgi:hypothetical protein
MGPITLQSIHIYPVKSLRAISLNKSAVERRGLQNDRRWMVVDSDGVFMSQRSIPKMAQVGTALEDGSLWLAREGMVSLRMPISDEGPGATVRVWNSVCEAVDCGEDAAGWLSTALGQPCRLVRMPETTIRPTPEEFSRPGDHVSFADGFPILIASVASLEDLNQRSPDSITMDRFRPNLVLAGAPPYAEDEWTSVQIEGLVLRNAKPCGRCQVTTLDPVTGESLGQEPLRTLGTYRKVGNNVNFATNYIPEVEGELLVGACVHPT